LADENSQEKHQTRQENESWQPTAKQNPPGVESHENSIILLAAKDHCFSSLAAKKSRTPVKSLKCQENILSAKIITFIGSH
jgi:hypothetical protein